MASESSSASSESEEYVARHSTVGSGAAGRATDGETDEALAAERESEWAPPGETPPEAATTPPDMTEMPDPDGSRHAL